MATRDLVTYNIDYSDGTSNSSYVTSARQTRFITLGIVKPDNSGILNLGGIQTSNMVQSNGGRYEAQAGDDYLEIIFGMRAWSGQFTRRALRGSDMEEMALKLYPDMEDVDWRDIPMILSTRYKYQNYNGSVTYEATEWRMRKAFITDHRVDAIPGPTDVMRETLSMIAAGHGRKFGNGKPSKTPDAIVGSCYFNMTKPATTVAQSSAATANPMPQIGGTKLGL